MNHRLLLVLIAPIMIVMVACAPPAQLRDENNLNDTSLLTGEPCEAPCWNDIIPGETLFRDALIQIEDEADYQNVQEADLEEEDTIRLFGFSDGDANVCCQVLSEDGEVVDSMLLLLAPVMTVGEVVDKYGDPTYVLGEGYSEDQALMFLFYPDVPMIVYAFVGGATEGTISEASEVIGVMYLTEQGIRQVIDGNRLYTWEGYQSFADYIDENFDFVGPDVNSDEDAPTDDTESDENEND